MNCDIQSTVPHYISKYFNQPDCDIPLIFSYFYNVDSNQRSSPFYELDRHQLLPNRNIYRS